MNVARLKNQAQALRNALEVLFVNHRAFHNDTIVVSLRQVDFVSKRPLAMFSFRVQGYDFNFEVLAIVKEVEKMLLDARVVEVRAMRNGDICLIVMHLGSRLTYHIMVEKAS